MQLIHSLCLACLVSFTSVMAFSQLPDIRVNQQRIENRIFELVNFGIDSTGKGYRVSYSSGYLEARAWLIDQMKQAGLEVSIDYAGNILGRRKGSDPSLKPIAFGSHIDMVPNGGNYDGCLGAISGLEVMQVLHENHIETNHPLELIITTDEEGSMVGSRSLAGNLILEDLNNTSHSGLTIREGLKVIGGDPDRIQSVARQKGDVAAFIELHIEQGRILETENIQIGIVKGIVGISIYDVTIEGVANHAGTTPMNLRQDALLAASKLILAIHEVINGHEGQQVGNVGKITVKPGAYNVIPEKVVLGMELRDLSYDKIMVMFKEIESKAAAIAASTGTSIAFKNKPPVVMPAASDTSIQNKIMEAATSLGYSYTFMPSGAGHDAQNMSLIAPMAMIFVPSVGGVSHSPKEFTKAVDMANGTNVLLHAILLLDKKE